jgi:hypothetical protein
MSAEKVYQIPSATPTLRGDYGQAWKQDISKMAEAYGMTSDQHATICQWIIFAPWAHPVWHCYGLDLYHLRPMPFGELKNPKLMMPNATHELALCALNPRTSVEIGKGIDPISPPNFVAQIVETDDQAAALRIHAAVREILDGTLNPDTDAVESWFTRFGRSNEIKRPL